jgi:hypothetical protein
MRFYKKLLVFKIFFKTPQIALQQLVAERLEIERQQRMAASIAASNAHTQTPPHNQNNVFASPGGQTPNQMMGGIIGGGNAGMGPPQMPPPSMGAMQPPLQSSKNFKIYFIKYLLQPLYLNSK